MVKSVVPGCKNDSRKQNKRKSNISLHRFPKNASQRVLWTEAVRLERNDHMWTPSNCSVICSMHFRDEHVFFTKCNARMVTKDAVPICTVALNINYYPCLTFMNEAPFSNKTVFCNKILEKILDQKLSSTEAVIVIKYKEDMVFRTDIKRDDEYILPHEIDFVPVDTTNQQNHQMLYNVMPKKICKSNRKRHKNNSDLTEHELSGKKSFNVKDEENGKTQENVDYENIRNNSQDFVINQDSHSDLKGITVNNDDNIFCDMDKNSDMNEEKRRKLNVEIGKKFPITLRTSNLQRRFDGYTILSSTAKKSSSKKKLKGKSNVPKDINLDQENLASDQKLSYAKFDDNTAENARVNLNSQSAIKEVQENFIFEQKISVLKPNSNIDKSFNPNMEVVLMKHSELHKGNNEVVITTGNATTNQTYNKAHTSNLDESEHEIEIRAIIVAAEESKAKLQRTTSTMNSLAPNESFVSSLQKLQASVVSEDTDPLKINIDMAICPNCGYDLTESENSKNNSSLKVLAKMKPGGNCLETTRMKEKYIVNGNVEDFSKLTLVSINYLEE